ncbi:PP2C-domain-containing protein [Meredithblackwellia eburnea MCA 4105]
MGQTLSEPVVDKHSASGEDERLAWGVSEMQGWRLTMEDSHAHVLSLVEGAEKEDRTSFFAVYDGHGGSSVARFAGDTVHHRLAANDFFKNKDYLASMKRAFLETDEDLRANPDFRGDPSGCTAVAALVTPDFKIICANAGDSRSVLSVGGEATAMSYDHKPTNVGENARIVAAGGFVEFGRVNGNLALSRALGDFEFKQNSNLDAEHQVVTADPDIIVHEPTPEDEFLVIACDGIWDVLSSQQVIDYVRRAIAEKKDLSTICEDLMDRCLAPDSDWGGVGCDNMTAMVVAILGDRTKEEWYNWVAERCENGVGYATPKEPVDPFAQGPRGAMGGAARAGGPGAGAGAGAGGVTFAHDNEDDDYAASGGGNPMASSAAALRGIQEALRAQGIHISGLGEMAEDEDEDEASIEEVEDAGHGSSETHQPTLTDTPPSISSAH